MADLNLSASPSSGGNTPKTSAPKGGSTGTPKLRTVLSRPARRSSGARCASARVKYQDHWKIPFDSTPRVTRWIIVHRFCGMRPRATIVIAAHAAATHIQMEVARSVRGTRGLLITPPFRPTMRDPRKASRPRR